MPIWAPGGWLSSSPHTSVVPSVRLLVGKLSHTLSLSNKLCTLTSHTLNFVLKLCTMTIIFVSIYLGLTQFDLSKEEMDRLHSKRWNFSSATTAIPQSKSEPVLPAHHGNGKETVGEAFRRLSLATNRTQAMTNVHLGSDLTAGFTIPESPLESPGITMSVPSPVSPDSRLPSMCKGVEREEGGDCVDGEGSGCSGADSGNTVTKVSLH